MEHRQQVKRYVLENYLFTDDDKALSDQDSLIRKGIVDSTGMLELVTFLQERFGIRVADEEMIPANLESIDAISAFVARKLAA
jgi:acyl carrier protein